ncbi:ferric-chelate reductase 1-like [Chironomus tepperi]|uniref:ferric-chelate reductase 1-like n=1 Tax=Chironomus tepperi TaxID=113505 RepID=UPI00391EEAFD
MWLQIIYIASLCILNAISEPGGASIAACETMMPIHCNYQGQTGSLPVKFEVQTPIISRGHITIRIEGTDDLPSFAGFLVQARKQTNELIGKFLTSEHVNVIDCKNISGSTATHTNYNQKTAVDIIWEAPGTTEPMVFNFQ